MAPEEPVEIGGTRGNHFSDWAPQVSPAFFCLECFEDSQWMMLCRVLKKQIKWWFQISIFPSIWGRKIQWSNLTYAYFSDRLGTQPLSRKQGALSVKTCNWKMQGSTSLRCERSWDKLARLKTRLTHMNSCPTTKREYGLWKGSCSWIYCWQLKCQEKPVEVGRVYPIIYMVLYIPGGCLRFGPPSSSSGISVGDLEMNPTI